MHFPPTHRKATSSTSAPLDSEKDPEPGFWLTEHRLSGVAPPCLPFAIFPTLHHPAAKRERACECRKPPRVAVLPQLALIALPNATIGQSRKLRRVVGTCLVGTGAGI